MVASKFIKSYRFFRKTESVARARALAKAEIWAEENGIGFVWDYEIECWDGDEPLPPRYELLMGAAVQGDPQTWDRRRESLASIGMVAVPSPSHIYGVPSPEIRRINADLALEAKENLEARDRKKNFLAHGTAAGW